MIKDISNIVKFANSFEDEFVKIVVDENYKRVQATQRKNQMEFQKLLSRDKYLDIIIEKLFEDKVLGNLSEERFLKVSVKYEEEQSALKQQIKNLHKVVKEEQTHEMDTGTFLQLVHRY